MSTNTANAIDLTPFCDPDPDNRYRIDKPFVQRGWLCATDTKTVAMLPAPDQPDTENTKGRQFPNVHSVIDVPKLTNDGTIQWNPWSAADYFEASAECETCNGKGIITDPKCKHCEGTGNHFCACHCKSDDYDGHECGCVSPCSICSRTGEFVFPSRQLIDGRVVDYRFDKKIRSLPGVEFTILKELKHDYSAIIFFRFAGGGFGAVMPLDMSFNEPELLAEHGDAVWLQIARRKVREARFWKPDIAEARAQ